MPKTYAERLRDADATGQTELAELLAVLVEQEGRAETLEARFDRKAEVLEEQIGFARELIATLREDFAKQGYRKALQTLKTRLDNSSFEL